MKGSKWVWVVVAVLTVAMMLFGFCMVSGRRDADDDRGTETAVEESADSIAADA